MGLIFRGKEQTEERSDEEPITLFASLLVGRSATKSNITRRFAPLMALRNARADRSARNSQLTQNYAEKTISAFSVEITITAATSLRS